MRKLLFFFFLLLGAITFTMSSCSEDIENIPMVQAKSQKDIEMDQLIQFVRDNTPSPIDPQTRGLWGKVKGWFKKIATADATGAGWARGSGADVGQSIRIAASTSLSAAIGTTQEQTVQWNINGDWKTYPNALREHEVIGNLHNQAIYEICRDNRNITSGSNLSVNDIFALVDKKLFTLGHSNGLSLLQRSELLLFMNDVRFARDASVITNSFLRIKPNMQKECELLDSYLNAVLEKNDKSEAVRFTEQVYNAINTYLTLDRPALKAMVSVALSSINLWNPVE